MKTLIGTLLLAITLASPLIGQPEIGFCRYYPQGNGGYFNDVYTVSEGGYIACGTDGNASVWLLRTDDQGNALWSRSYQQNSNAHTIIELDNGDFLAAGTWWTGGMDNPYLCGAVRVGLDGEPRWNRTYAAGVVHAAIELKAGSIVLAGICWVDLESVGYMVCIDVNGNPIWENFYRLEEPSLALFSGMRETDDGIVAVGFSRAEPTRFLTWMHKVDFDGEVIWSHLIGDGPDSSQYICQSIVSCPEGFALAGHVNDRWWDMWTEDILVALVNNEGELLSDRRYNFGAPDRYNNALSLVRLDQGGYMVAGIDGLRDPQNLGLMCYKPIALRLDDNLDMLWGMEVELNNQNHGMNFFHSVTTGQDSSVVFAGKVDDPNAGWLERGLLMTLDGANPGGGGGGGGGDDDPNHFGMFRYSPVDLGISCLENDDITFVCRAFDNHRIEADYCWTLNGDTLGNDTTVTVNFNFLGQYSVGCMATVGELNRLVEWNINVTRIYIDDYFYDVLNEEDEGSTGVNELTIARGQTVTFQLNTRRAEDGVPEYRWILTDRNRMRTLVGEDSTVTITFPLAGDCEVEGTASMDGFSDSKTWIVHVRSFIWSWFPNELSLTVPADSILNFLIQPYAPVADSLAYTWFSDGRSAGHADSFLVSYSVPGQHRVLARVTKGRESETVTWNVLVNPNNVDGAFPALPFESRIVSIAPNPVNSTAAISFSLPFGTTDFSLSIYDLSGRLVADLSGSTGVSAGQHKVVWDATHLSAGIYIVKLNIEGKSMSRKIVLLR